MLLSLQVGGIRLERSTRPALEDKQGNDEEMQMRVRIRMERSRRWWQPNWKLSRGRDRIRRANTSQHAREVIVGTWHRQWGTANGTSNVSVASCIVQAKIEMYVVATILFEIHLPRMMFVMINI
jgi:hypothetical protein